MPLDFPNSPTVNQEFTANGITWKYDGVAWNIVSGGSGFRVSSGAPSSPALGDLWYDTESGEMFIYYDSAWVSPSVVASVIASVKVSDTPPTNPAVGDIWFDSSNGDMTIYYDSQWVSPSVAASLSTATATTITGTNSEGTSNNFARADHNHNLNITPSWIAPTFGAGWTNYGLGFESAGYYKDKFGFVHLRGLVKRTTGTEINIFILPEGFRPSSAHILPIIGNGGIGRVDINSAGQVIYQGGGTDYFSLGGVYFSV